MKNVVLKAIVIMIGIGLVGCATTQHVSHKKGVNVSNRTPVTANKTMENENTPPPPVKMSVASDIEKSMDENDKFKMSHALDKSLGKPTHWMNDHTKISYTVTPVKKLSMNGNKICRKYTIMSVRGTNKNETIGTACVSAEDSNWQIVN